MGMPQIADEQVITLIKTTSNLPLVKVSREDYLRKEFSKDYYHIMDDILEKGPYEAGVPIDVIEKKAKFAISYERTKASAISFLTGLPGGVAMAGTIPADLSQFMGHCMRIVQKLAYLSGMPGFSDSNDMTDEEANIVLIYLGVMFGESQAAMALKTLAKYLSGVALKEIPKIALTKVVGYQMIKSILKALGIRLTKNLAAKTVSKIIPIAGGVISGGMTFITVEVMSKRLYDKLAESRFDNN